VPEPTIRTGATAMAGAVLELLKKQNSLLAKFFSR